MPKIIKDIEEKILEVVEAELKTKSINQLTMRDIAKQCDLGLGTIYNYFPNKIYLVANLLLKDWNEVLTKIDNEFVGNISLEKGIEIIYQELKHYGIRYQNVFKDYDFSGSKQNDFYTRHLILRQQIIEKLTMLLNISSINVNEQNLLIASELIISGSTKEEIEFTYLRKAIQKILKEEKYE